MESTTQEKKEKATRSKYLSPAVGYGILFAAIVVIVGIALLRLLPLL